MRSEKRRLDMLISTFRPAKSLGSRLANLTPDQRAAYQIWRNQAGQWHRDHPGANAYERILEGELGPQLRKNVANALFVQMPSITDNMSMEQAAESYARFTRGDW